MRLMLGVSLKVLSLSLAVIKFHHCEMFNRLFSHYLCLIVTVPGQ